MAKVVLSSLIVLLFASQIFASCSSSSTLNVFEQGKYSPRSFSVKQSETESSPPKPLRIVSPTTCGSFPVILFLHGTCFEENCYSQLFKHIASHGYIVVAPQLYSSSIPSCGFNELEDAASVINWLPTGLRSVLSSSSAGVVADLKNNFSIAGHSRGAKQAFALAIAKAKQTLQLKFRALVAIDPVAGHNAHCFVTPEILSSSLNLDIPVTIIGTGLGNQPKDPFLCSCAPDKVNHVEFFLKSNAPKKGHFIATEYGHFDILDDVRGAEFCKASSLPRNDFRTTAGGLTVAFLEYIDKRSDAYMRIVGEPNLAPAKLEAGVSVSRTEHQVAIGDEPHVKLQLSNQQQIPVETMHQTEESCDQESACTLESIMKCLNPTSYN